MWVPELKRVPIEYLHEPWTMPADLQKGCKTIIGVDYPKPIKCDKYTNIAAHKVSKAVKKGERDNEKKIKETKLKQTKLKQTKLK